MPKSACTDGIFLVLKKPFKYAVAGYGVFSCVNGGVINNTGADKENYFHKNKEKPIGSSLMNQLSC